MDPNQTVATFNTVEPLLFWLVASLTGLCAVATVVTQNIVRAATWLLFTLAGTSAIFFLLGADLVGATQLLVYVGGTLILVVFGVMLTAQGPFISMKTSGAEWAISMVAGLLLLAVLTTGIMTESSIGAPTLRITEIDPQTKETRHASIIPDVKIYSPRQSRAERQHPKAPKPLQILKKSPLPVGGPPPDFARDLAPGNKADADKAKGDNRGPDGAAGGPEAEPLKLAQSPPPVMKKERPMPLDPATSPQSAVIGEGFLGVGVGPAHHEGRSRAVVRTSYLLPFEIVSVHLLVVLIGAAYLARAKRRPGAES
jgi:NADH:ubiquinone oxidoreductase subunit 6 (subunit J)